MVHDVVQRESESGVLGLVEDGLHGISFFAELKWIRGGLDQSSRNIYRRSGIKLIGGVDSREIQGYESRKDDARGVLGQGIEVYLGRLISDHFIVLS